MMSALTSAWTHPPVPGPFLTGPLLAGQMLAQFSLGGVVERVLGLAIVAAVTSWITIAVLKNQLATLEGGSRRQGVKIEEVARDQAALRSERSQCELRATRTFATQESVAQNTVDLAANARDVAKMLAAATGEARGSVNRVHKRVDVLTERVTRIEAVSKKGPT